MKKHNLSLSLKAVLLIVLFALLLGGLTIGISGYVINRLVNNNYKRSAVNISSTLSVTLDPQLVEACGTMYWKSMKTVMRSC